MLLRSLATVTEGTTVGEYDRYNMQRTVTVTANVSGQDLGSVAKKVAEGVGAGRKLRPRAPRSTCAARSFP